MQVDAFRTSCSWWAACEADSYPTRHRAMHARAQQRAQAAGHAAAPCFALASRHGFLLHGWPHHRQRASNTHGVPHETWDGAVVALEHVHIHKLLAHRPCQHDGAHACMRRLSVHKGCRKPATGRECRMLYEGPRAPHTKITTPSACCVQGTAHSAAGFAAQHSTASAQSETESALRG